MLTFLGKDEPTASPKGEGIFPPAGGFQRPDLSEEFSGREVRKLVKRKKAHLERISFATFSPLRNIPPKMGPILGRP